MSVIPVSDGWQVINDPLQWIVQRHDGKRWRDEKFCTTRLGLRGAVLEHCGAVNPKVLAHIDALPEFHYLGVRDE